MRKITSLIKKLSKVQGIVIVSVAVLMSIVWLLTSFVEGNLVEFDRGLRIATVVVYSAASFFTTLITVIESGDVC